MAVLPSLCRLCITTSSDDFKSLYDEYGQANGLYTMIYEYFHPKIVDLEKARHLTAICLQCFRHIQDFHSFQNSVTIAQLKLFEEDKTMHTSTEEADIPQSEIQFQPMAIKVENEEFIGFTPPDYVVERDSSQIMKEEFITLSDIQIEDSTPSTSMNNHQINESFYIRGVSNEEEDRKDNFSCPALKITDVDGSSTSTTDDLIPLVRVGTRKHNNESTRLLPVAEDEDRKDNISLPPLEIMDVDTDSSYTLDDEIPLVLVDSSVAKSRSSDSVPIRTIDHVPKYHETLEYLLAKWIPDIKCFKCTKSFSSWLLVKSHFQRRHPNETFYYICCSRKFTRFNIKDHLRLHGDPDAFKCSICDMRYKTGTSLRFHYAEKHPESLKIQCDKCGKHCTSKSGLSTHQRQMHKSDGQDLPNPIVASTSHCPDTAVNPTTDDQKSSGDQLGNTHETLENLLAKWIPNIKCFECSKRFPSWSLVKSHFKRRHPNEKFYYKCCSRKFYHKVIKDHLSLHSDPDAFKCSICDNRYTSRATLSAHNAETHTESSKFPCDKCGKRFMSKQGLATHHHLIHHSNQQLHLKIQVMADGRTAYNCQLCGETKYSISMFKRHKSKMHGFTTSKVACTICGQWCLNARTFREHMASHEKKRLYKCAFCPGAYISLATIKKHRKKHHPLESGKEYYTNIGDIDRESESNVNSISAAPIENEESGEDSRPPINVMEATSARQDSTANIKTDHTKSKKEASSCDGAMESVYSPLSVSIKSEECGEKCASTTSMAETADKELIENKVKAKAKIQTRTRRDISTRAKIVKRCRFGNRRE